MAVGIALGALWLSGIAWGDGGELGRVPEGGVFQFTTYEEDALPPSAPMPLNATVLVSTDESNGPSERTQGPLTEEIGDFGAVPPELGPPSGKPWTIPQPALLQKWGINMGGWLQQGITGNASNPPDRFNGPMATNDRSGEYQLNQAWVYFVRPTKTDGCGFDLGGRVDLAYGTDWRYGMNPGLENRIDSANQFYGMILPQFYVEAAFNDLTVKLGHYATGMGHEMVPAVGNFFYSHNYLMSYTEPLLVTGLEANYKLNDRWTLVGGLNRGWMMFEDTNRDWDYLAGFRWKSEDQRTGLSLLLDAGEQTDFFGADHYRTVYAFVLSHQFSPTLGYAVQYNYGRENAGALQPYPPTGDDAEWYGVCQWLTYTLNPKLTVGMRLEWFRDDDGDRVAGVGGWIGSNRGWTGAPGFAGDFYEMTVGLNWRPHSNFLVRPELRYDWYNGTPNIAGQLPFDAGDRRDQLTFAVDLVNTF
jgi:hypothetical protein